MPAITETGIALVLVQHLAPDHRSILCELVQRYTKMEVQQVVDGMPVKPGCAYIIPPNRDMALHAGKLQLFEPHAPRGIRLPIDFFFRSLAADQRDHAICIILSGTGSDGTLGLRAVKGEGGMAMAQNPESTEFDSMPRSAIATGLVDYVLPPAEMPAQLIAFREPGLWQETQGSCHRRARSHKMFSPKYASFYGPKPATISPNTRRIPSLGASNAAWRFTKSIRPATICASCSKIPTRPPPCFATYSSA